MSRPETSTPQTPSPVEIGWVTPAERTAWMRIRAQAVISPVLRATPVVGHLVGKQPADDGGVAAEATGDLGREPRLLRDHPDVPVADPCPPRQDGSQFWPDMCPTMNVGIVPRPISRWASRKSANRAQTSSSIRSGDGHEVGPVAERACDVATVRGEDGEFLAHESAVVAAPHPGTATTRPEVGADPDRNRRGVSHQASCPRPLRAGACVSVLCESAPCALAAHLAARVDYPGVCSVGRTHRSRAPRRPFSRRRRSPAATPASAHIPWPSLAGRLRGATNPESHRRGTAAREPAEASIGSLRPRAPPFADATSLLPEQRTGERYDPPAQVWRRRVSDCRGLAAWAFTKATTPRAPSSVTPGGRGTSAPTPGEAERPVLEFQDRSGQARQHAGHGARGGAETAGCAVLPSCRERVPLRNRSAVSDDSPIPGGQRRPTRCETLRSAGLATARRHREKPRRQKKRNHLATEGATMSTCATEQERGTMANETVFVRYPGNPIVTASAVPRANSIHNSAIVKRAIGDYAGVFRVDEISMHFTLHVGFSGDGINWKIDPAPLAMQSDDAEVFVTDQSYDPRLTRIDDTYYLTWCNASPQGPAIGLATTTDFRHFSQWDNPLPPANRNCVLFPRKIGGDYAIYHRPSDRGHTPFGDIFFGEEPRSRPLGPSPLRLRPGKRLAIAEGRSRTAPDRDRRRVAAHLPRSLAEL